MLLSKVFSDYNNIKDVCPQLSLSVINRCEEVGIRTVVDFVLCGTEELAKKTAIPYKHVSYIHNFLLAEYSAFSQRGDSFYDFSLQTTLVIKTGCTKLDDFLSGGIYSGEITEIYGPSSAGKTQFCFSVAASFLVQHTCVLYLDTNNSFSVKRMSQILHFNLGLEEDFSEQSQAKEMLQNLEVINVNEISHLFEVLHAINASLSEQLNYFYQNLKLIIIDSITHLLSPCLGGLQFDGHGCIMSIAQKLKCMSQKRNLCVVICNNTVHGEAETVKAALGPSWKYVPSVMLCISKADEEANQQNKRKITRLKSCRNGTFGEIVVAISEAGIKD